MKNTYGYDRLMKLAEKLYDDGIEDAKEICNIIEATLDVRIELYNGFQEEVAAMVE